MADGNLEPLPHSLATDPTRRARALLPVLREGHGGFATSRADAVVRWARRHAMSVAPFVAGCCGTELQALAGPRYDAERFGLDLPRVSPRQADLLMVAGTVTRRQAALVKEAYDRMAEPKWVMAVGACACSGGPYDNYAVVQGVDTIVPVDVYVPGCPPRPEAILDGILKLQERVRVEPVGAKGRHREVDARREAGVE